MTQRPSQGRERRRLKRIVKRIPAAFEADSLRGKGHVKNVSKGGLFLRSEVLPRPGAFVRVLFHDRSGAKVEVIGEVAWTTEQLPSPEARPGFGMRFDDPSDEYLEFFEEILTL